MGSHISIIARRKKLSLVLDGLLVLFNIINGGLSILPFFVIDSIPTNLFLGAMLNIVWCISNFTHIRPSFSPQTLVPFICVLFYQLFLGRLEFSMTMLVLDISFLAVLFGILGKYKDQALTFLSDVYIFYSLCNVIGVCLAFLLITFGVLDPYSNSLNLHIITYDDGVAFFPGYLTVIRPNDVVRVSFLGISGAICGFSHEPNAVGYVCLPAFFLLLNRCKNRSKLLKASIIGIYILFFLVTISVTSFLSVTIVSFIGLFLAGRQKGHHKSWILLILLIVIIIAAASFIGDAFSWVFNKMSASDGSGDYSKDRISYAFTPNTFFGTTIYTTTIDGDIGVITMLLNIWYYISAGLLCWKMLRNKNREIFFFGLMFLYFLCHSMKIFIMVYRYPYTLFVIFLSYLVLYNNNDRIRKFRKKVTLVQ